MPRVEFDNWSELYAKRIGRLRASEVRQLLAVTARPDIISFAGGLPDTKAFPVQHIVEATRYVMEENGHIALQYGPSEGHTGLKEKIVELMGEEGIEAEPDDLIITDGAQQALDLIGKVFISAGDTIVIEAPSYVGALQAFSTYEPSYVTIPLDEQGLKTSLLAEQLEKLAQAGRKVKFLYLVPNFHNPVGVTLSEKRRHEVLKLAEKYGFLIVEDNPYGRLRFEGKNLPSLRALNKNVIYISTFSKIFSPGVRLGWIVAPRPILEKIICAKQAANLCSSSFGQRVAEAYFRHFDWQGHIRTLIELYRGRRDTMLEAIAEFFPPEAKWTKPEGGLFIWVTLPEGIDTASMLAEAIQEAKVAYVPGQGFYPEGGGEASMRLNFSYSEKEKIYIGIESLSKVIKKQLALYRSLAKGSKLAIKKVRTS
jgi:2-aminoadipate transaminase